MAELWPESNGKFNMGEFMQKRMFRLVALILFVVFGTAQAADYTEGKDYARINPAQPAAGPGKVQVVELFWYGCPHCYQFDPHLEKWLENKPDYVEFVRMPAIFSNKVWKMHAAAFYTAEVLGVLDKIHMPLFDAIHKHKRPMKTQTQVAEFFADHGVSEEEFIKTMNSFAVQAKVKRAADMTRRYRIGGVPNIIVNGKYRVDGPMAKTYENLIRILNHLVEKEYEGAKAAKLSQ